MKCKECGNKINYGVVSTERGETIYWDNNIIVAKNRVCVDCLDED